MNRKIFCEGCGTLKPMHPEDIAMGFDRRRVTGNAKKPDVHQVKEITAKKTKTTDLATLFCDLCGMALPDGTKVVAVTMWNKGREKTPFNWEQEYLTEIK